MNVQLDELNFQQVYFGIHLAQGGTQVIQVVLPPNASFFKVLVLDTSFAYRYSYKAGYMRHLWGFTNPTLVNYWRLPIQLEKLLISHSVVQSSLEFKPASWLYEFSLTVDAA